MRARRLQSRCRPRWRSCRATWATLPPATARCRASTRRAARAARARDPPLRVAAAAPGVQRRSAGVGDFYGLHMRVHVLDNSSALIDPRPAAVRVGARAQRAPVADGPAGAVAVQCCARSDTSVQIAREGSGQLSLVTLTSHLTAKYVRSRGEEVVFCAAARTLLTVDLPLL